MADVSLYRGGTADFKGWFRRGDYAEFHPPFSAPQMASTPPYNSHADAAYGQGYLNLQFPLVPHIEDTTAHGWMWNALRKLETVGDRIYTNWIPMRSTVMHFHWEVTRFDDALTGVYLKPIAVRVKLDFGTGEFTYEDNSEYATMLTSNNVGQFPLGTPADGDTPWAYAYNSTPLCTFGHNIPTLDTDTMKPTGGLDDYFGAVVLGYEVAAGDDEKIAQIWNGNFALYFSCKCLAFEGASQV